MADRKRSVLMALTMIFLQLVALQCETASFVVGDRAGWTMNMAAGWEKGKTFHAGDTLVFNYPKGKHNVVVVEGGAYVHCNNTKWNKVYTSGKDKVTLVKGFNYFICGMPSHCTKMKIQLMAL